jgi:hypothetical protein
MNSNMLEWLEAWYTNQCDGEWEHGWGIQMGTFETPGWYVTIELRKTKLEWKRTNWMQIGQNTPGWHAFRFTNGTFEGIGGPISLPSLLAEFRKVAEK